MSDFEKMWQSLPRDLFTSMNKGSKAEAQKEWNKLAPDADTIEKMKAFLERKERADRKNRQLNAFVPGWPHFCRMLKRKFWLDDDPYVRRDKIPGRERACGCGAPVEHGTTGLCWACYDKRYGDTLVGWYKNG